MADDKKAGGAPKVAAPAQKKPLEIIIGLVFILAVLGALVNNVSNYLATNSLSFYGLSLSSVKDFFFGNGIVFRLISLTFSMGALSGVVALSHLKAEILLTDKLKLFPQGTSEIGKMMGEEDNETRERWQKIVENSESEVESNWRIAIIEADIILDDLLYKLNLPGDTIGEKLTAVEQSDFLTLEAAWEAHKVRNRIAHGGSDFLLNQRETRRIISLYEKVFKEFYLI